MSIIDAKENVDTISTKLTVTQIGCDFCDKRTQIMLNSDPYASQIIKKQLSFLPGNENNNIGKWQLSRLYKLIYRKFATCFKITQRNRIKLSEQLSNRPHTKNFSSI